MKIDAKNYASIKGEPVLLFDNRPSGFSSYPELMTVAEAAGFLRISKTGVRRLQPYVHHYKIMGGIRFAKADLLSYLAQVRTKPIG